jgi:hypothetical protein
MMVKPGVVSPVKKINNGVKNNRKNYEPEGILISEMLKSPRMFTVP